MKISYDEIRRIHRLEKNTQQIVPVEPDFYNELFAFISEGKKSYMQALKDFSVSGSNDFSNAKKMVEEIFSMREKKLLGKALISSRTGESSETGLAVQEKELLRRLAVLLKEHGVLLEELFSEKQKNHSAEPSFLETMQVKIVSDIPSFVGNDFVEYGPFSKNQTVELPLKVAKLLSQRNLAVTTEN